LIDNYSTISCISPRYTWQRTTFTNQKSAGKYVDAEIVFI